MLRTWLICSLALTLSASVADAHVYRTRTLRSLVADADLVLRVRIVSTPGPTRSSPVGSTTVRRPEVEADVLETLKGAERIDAPRVRFVQHGHGVVSFAPGDETLLFLQDITRNRELAALARSGEHAWVSPQEAGDEYPLDATTRQPLLDAVRAYVATGSIGDPAARTDLLRRATVGLLATGDARLGASALRDCARTPDLPLLTREDVPALTAVLDDPSASMGLRAGLLAELERRGLVDGAPRWLALLSGEAATPDRLTAVRAAGRAPGAVVRARLVELLDDPDPHVAAAACFALGTPGDATAIAPLSAALTHEQAPVRSAAIRALGQIGTPEARSTLAAAARSHPDPATRRRAGAELHKRP